MWKAVACALLLAAPIKPALSPEPQGRPEHGVGFVLGPIGGIGFAYRTFNDGGSGWQIGGLAYADRSDTTVIVGAQAMHTLRLHARSRLYALAGAMHIRDRDSFDELVAAPAPGAPGAPVFRRVERDDSSTRIGAGLGMSFGGADGVCAALELPLVIHFDEHGDVDGVGPIPQVSLIYNY